MRIDRYTAVMAPAVRTAALLRPGQQCVADEHMRWRATDTDTACARCCAVGYAEVLPWLKVRGTAGAWGDECTSSASWLPDLAKRLALRRERSLRYGGLCKVASTPRACELHVLHYEQCWALTSYSSHGNAGSYQS